MTLESRQHAATTDTTRSSWSEKKPCEHDWESLADGSRFCLVCGGRILALPKFEAYKLSDPVPDAVIDAVAFVARR